MGVRPGWACAETTEPASPGSAVGPEGEGPPSRVQVQVGRRVGGGNVPGGSPEAGGAGEPLVYPSLPQVIMPGYCVQGTVGHKILSGQRKLEMEGRQVVSPHLSLPALWIPLGWVEALGTTTCADGPHTAMLQLEVKMQVEYMSFSAHADAKGIMQLVGQAEPENVLLVHGETKKMEFLKQKIEQEFRRQSRQG